MSKFKNANGVLLLKELFFELANNRDNVLYTLKREDHVWTSPSGEVIEYPSLYRLYMEASDPTEYAFAIAHLHSWDHWKLLSETSWLAPEVRKWREELEVRSRSIALANIMKKAASSDRDAFSAAKYIAEGWGKPSRTRGRPSKETIAKEAREIADAQSREAVDYLRLVSK